MMQRQTNQLTSLRPQPFFNCGLGCFDEVVRPGMLCAFDFDGTLAPIVKHPSHASIPRVIERKLMYLAKYARVVIISGRSAEDIQSRLNFVPHAVIGNHGAEGLPGYQEQAMEFYQICKSWEWQLSMALSGMEDCGMEACGQGIRMENKRQSIAVHYRLAKNPAFAEARLMEVFHQLHPLPRILPGKRVLNLIPQGAPDKGDALELLCQDAMMPYALYVGDDITDEDVFRRRRREWLTIHVERSDNSDAEFFLFHRVDLIRLLDMLIRRLHDCVNFPR